MRILRELPPLYIQVGSTEVLLDESRRVAEKAKAAGVAVEIEVWPDMPHVWQLYAPMVPEARDSTARPRSCAASRSSVRFNAMPARRRSPDRRP